ncbi:MAG: nuclear transport factor 2 family protein [Holophagaceae bacterium]|nr:nuclear transport factor 2 family protein [Holophagaceae bacterium]
MLPFPGQTETVVQRHLAAFARRSVDELLLDYAETSVLLLPSGPLRGLGELRTFFANLIETLPDGFLEAFEVKKLEYLGEVAFLVWQAHPWVNLGVDTFLVRDHRIQLQTFASHPLSWMNRLGQTPRSLEVPGKGSFFTPQPGLEASRNGR